MQIDWAVQIMLPFINKGDYDEEFLITFLNIAVYDEKHVPEEKLHEHFLTVSEKYPDAFCKMFDKSGMSLEYLIDLRLKSIFCDTCH